MGDLKRFSSEEPKSKKLRLVRPGDSLEAWRNAQLCSLREVVLHRFLKVMESLRDLEDLSIKLQLNEFDADLAHEIYIVKKSYPNAMDNCCDFESFHELTFVAMDLENLKSRLKDISKRLEY